MLEYDGPQIIGSVTSIDYVNILSGVPLRVPAHRQVVGLFLFSNME